MKKIAKQPKTQREIIDMFLNYKKEVSFSGVTFASITYFVNEYGSKTVKGKHILKKLVTRNITLGASYQDKINRLLEREGQEGKFESQEMTGKRYVMADNRFVAETIKTGEKLLCFIGETRTKPKTTYFFEGKKISNVEARTEKYFTPAGLNPKRAEMGGIEDKDKFYFNTVYFKNIVAITMNKTRFVIED